MTYYGTAEHTSIDETAKSPNRVSGFPTSLHHAEGNGHGPVSAKTSGTLFIASP